MFSYQLYDETLQQTFEWCKIDRVLYHTPERGRLYMI